MTERSKAMLFWCIVAVLCMASVLWGMFGWLFWSADVPEVEPVDTEAREAVRQAEALIREHAARAR